MGMAYDAAHGEVVLFGGEAEGGYLGDTWTWDGTEWTRLFPAHSPPARSEMGMAYDAADGQVVMFGGTSDQTPYFGDTWTWNGTDWTKRSPSHSPSKRFAVGMAYDAAEAQVVLFAGWGAPDNDTWTWDGTDWTHRTPARSPSWRDGMGMADDVADGQVVLFGGDDNSEVRNTGLLNDTWTWDGTDWTDRSQTNSPPPPGGDMAYDAADGQVVLFGSGTWTWDGTEWARRHPRHSPSTRGGFGMADGVVVGFGGGSLGPPYYLGDTWTWDGVDWAMPIPASITAKPSSGPPGTVVTVSGKDFGAVEKVMISFIDSTSGTTKLVTATTDGAGAFSTQVTIPANATPGKQLIRAKGRGSGQVRTVVFTVT
jgi:hypothetical protein